MKFNAGILSQYKGRSRMHRRRAMNYLPRLERLEGKQLLSSNAPTSLAAHAPLISHSAHAPGAVADAGQVAMSQGSSDLVLMPQSVSQVPAAQKPNFGFLVYRITNPNRFNRTMQPPFGQVLVQAQQPIPGQVYNVLFVVVRNGTAQTFDSSSGFAVRIPQSTQSFPILTGNEQWKPGQRIVFYILTKKYYPMPSVVHSGFEFDLGGARSVAIPGPSGIFLRIKYDPAKFPQTLNNVVVFGQGNQGGRGAKFGLPNTAINEFLSSKTRRIDFGGYF
jgi:hypothetical protein